MVSVKWCLRIKNGIELVEPNKNMADSYLKMAEESLKMIRNVRESQLWTASTSYYVMYYSLYSVMMKFGIKCEIHRCSIEFMSIFLKEFYSKEDMELINIAFNFRTDLQYYPCKLVDGKKLEFVRNGAVDFFVKTKDVLSNVNSQQIDEVRIKVKEVITNE